LQAIGVAGQGITLVKDQIDRRAEAIGGVARGMHHASRLDGGDDGVHGIGIDRLGILAAKTQDDGAAAAMADTGKGERAM
jgi:hypothetical protein